MSQADISNTVGPVRPQSFQLGDSIAAGERRDTYKIMIVDDVPVNIQVVQAYLINGGYEDFVTLTDSTQAIERIGIDDPDILLLDIMMPGVSGLDILQALRADERHVRLPVIILTGADSGDLKRKALEIGATDFLSKPFDPDDLIPRVRNLLTIKGYQDDLEEKVRERTAELEKSRQDIIDCLARAAEYRDNETGQHVVRVGCYAGIIARELNMDTEFVRLLTQAAKLHDVGKIAIPDAILLKPGKLTPEEFAWMQDHCGYGRKIFERISNDEADRLMSHATLGASIISGCNSPVLDLASTIALTHHERWDGTGYPLGLAGQNIPIEGRITAVADVFDALSSKRPYKPPFPQEKCFAVLEEGRGTHFDPKVLDAFFSARDDIVAIQIRCADLP